MLALATMPAYTPPSSAARGSSLAATNDTNVTRSRARVAEAAYPTLFATLAGGANATAEGASPVRQPMAQEAEQEIPSVASPFAALADSVGAVAGGMGALDSIAQATADKFKPEELIKGAADELQHLPDKVKDDVRDSVLHVVDSLPPALRDFMQERIGRLTKAMPDSLKEELKHDPGALLRHPDELAGKMSETQQADAGAAVQDLLLGALQYAVTQPQQLAEKVNGLLQTLPKEFTSIVTHTSDKMQRQAEDVVSGLPPSAVGDMQRLVSAFAPMLSAAGGAGAMAGYGQMYGQQPGYGYPAYGFPAAVGADGAAVPQAMAQAGGAQPLSSQMQYNQQLQAMQYYYMQQMQYMQAQMNYLQQLQAANNAGTHPAAHAATGGGDKPAAAAAAAAAQMPGAAYSFGYGAPQGF